MRSRKYRIVTAVERLNNRLTRFALRKDIAPPAFAPLETTGRRTGIPRHTPVGNGCIGDTFWLVAAHGTQADYVRNLQVLPSRSLTLLRCSILVAEAVFGWVRYPRAVPPLCGTTQRHDVTRRAGSSSVLVRHGGTKP